MKTLNALPLYVCGCCKRSLPVSAFYLNKRTGHPESYCKECRKALSRRRREQDKQSVVDAVPADYPVITRIADPAVRKRLILNALAVVNASIARKRRRLSEEEPEFEQQ